MPPKRKLTLSTDDSRKSLRSSSTAFQNGGNETKKAEMKSKMERLTRETMVLKQEIIELKDIIANVVRQNQTILNLVGEQQVMIAGIFKVESKPHSPYVAKFPLQNQFDLDAMEAEIDESNREKLVSTVQSLLSLGGLKNLNAIISMDLCLDYNIEGIHNKKRLQNYPKVLDLLFRATMKTGYTNKMFIDDLRKALKFLKNRHFKSVCMQRKKEREDLNLSTVSNEADFDDDDDGDGDGDGDGDDDPNDEDYTDSKDYVM